MSHRTRALLEVKERVHDDACTDCQQPSLRPDEDRQVDDHSCKRRKVCAESLEKVFEGRDDENQKNNGYDKSDDHDRSRVGQRFFDFFLDRLGFFFVRCDLVKQGLESTCLLACCYQVDEQVVEIQWMFGKRLRKSAAALDVCLHCHNQLLHRCVFVALTDDFESLYQRNTCGEHRR